MLIAIESKYRLPRKYHALRKKNKYLEELGTDG